MYRRVADIHHPTLFWRFYCFLFIFLYFFTLNTPNSTEITTLKPFYSSLIAVIFNESLTGLLVTLKSDNRRSRALKGKQRTARKQRSLAEGLQGMALFLESKICYFYWSQVNNKLCQ